MRIQKYIQLNGGERTIFYVARYKNQFAKGFSFFDAIKNLLLKLK